MNKSPMSNQETRRWWLGLISAAGLAMPGALLAQQAEDDDEIIDEIIVEGVAYGAARAIQQQRNSDTIVTIVSEETLENIPEQSVGEALSRLPGVSIQRDRGEAQTITIRGADARLNAVTINGDRLAQPESTLASEAFRGQRSPSLNAIPSTLISGIEVFKAVPPNMDGDSIGGAVEIKTKTATELEEPMFDATARFGHNDLNDGTLTSGEFTWGSRLNDAGTWGAMVTLSYEENERGISGLQAAWDTVDELLDFATDTEVPLDGEFHVIEDYDVIWRGFTRTRQGANITFDYRSGDNLIAFGGWISDFEDDEERRRSQFRPGASADYGSDTVFDSQGRAVSGSTDGGRVRQRLREGTNEKESRAFFIEGEHLFGGAWEFDWRASRTEGENTVNRLRGRFEVQGRDIGQRGDGLADWTFTNGNQDVVRWTVPDWGLDPDLLTIGRDDRGDGQYWRNQNANDEVNSVRADLSRLIDLGDGNDLTVQFGYKGRFRDRETNYRIFEFDGDEADPILFSEIIGERPDVEWSVFGYDQGQWGNIADFDALLQANPGRISPAGDNLENSYDVDETIHAAYLMGTLKSGPWTTVFGVRYEDTEADVTASDGTTITNAYDNFLPAVIVRYELTDNQILRGAWTNSISRPDFDDLRPLYDDEFEWDTTDLEAELSVAGGNPDLEPFEAMNFDLAYEYYTDTGGVFGVGMFYKEIENFEYTEELRENDVPITSLPVFLQDIAREAIDDARQTNPAIPADVDLASFRFQRPVNGDSADVLGWEFNYQQQFVNLPAPWNGFGVFLNYTTIDGDSDIAEGVSRDFVIGQFEDASNFQLFWENDSFTARIAYNRSGLTYRSIGLSLEDDGSVGSDPDDDLGIDIEESWDLALQYRRDLRNDALLTIFFDVQNLADDNSRNFFLGSQSLRRFTELEYGGRSFNLGFRYSR